MYFFYSVHKISKDRKKFGYDDDVDSTNIHQPIHLTLHI